MSGATIFFVSACQFVWLLWLSAVQLVRRDITERLDACCSDSHNEEADTTVRSVKDVQYLMCSDHQSNRTLVEGQCP